MPIHSFGPTWHPSENPIGRSLFVYAFCAISGALFGYVFGVFVVSAGSAVVHVLASGSSAAQLVSRYSPKVLIVFVLAGTVRGLVSGYRVMRAPENF